MSHSRLGQLLFLLIVGAPLWAQQLQDASPETTLQEATKDSQAVSLVNQVLNAVGGEQAVTTVLDYTAKGSITEYPGSESEVHGTVILEGRGLHQFRMDTTLPKGTRSEITNGHTTIRDENNRVTTRHTQAPLDPARLALPYQQLWASLHSRNLNLLYKGPTELNGIPTQHIQIQHLIPGKAGKNQTLMDFLSIDFFIDPSTFHVVMMQDHLSQYLTRQIEYSAFTTINGLLVPSTIAATIHGQSAWIIALGQISFNSGLQTSDFELK